MKNTFKGISGISSVIKERQQQEMETLRDKSIDDIAEKARRCILTFMREHTDTTEQDIEREITNFIDQSFMNMTHAQKSEVVELIRNELRGYGPLQELMDDQNISDIIIHHYEDITYEKFGKVYNYPRKFRSENHLRLLIERLCYLGGRRIDESNPLVTLTLPEGWRVTITIPPVALSANIAIRKFVWTPRLEDLVDKGTLSEVAAEFLKLTVPSRRNTVFTGGMGTGKTTMIGVLGHYFKDNEYPVLVEEVMECPLECAHLRRLVARPPNIEGKGEIKLDLLIKYSLTMRASRVLVSEVKDGAAFHMLQAMMIGHDGSMGTFHARNAKEAATKRLPALLSMAPEMSGIPYEEQLRYISAALHLIVHLRKMEDGTRKVVEIAEVDEGKDTPLVVNPIYKLEQGRLVATGHVPEAILEGSRMYGVDMPASLFRKGVIFA